MTRGHRVAALSAFASLATSAAADAASIPPTLFADPPALVAPAPEAAPSTGPERRAPARGLSLVQVVGVRSAASPDWELVPRGAIGSTRDHGGSWIQIAVYERGYGSYYPVAKMAGTQLPRTANFQNDPVCGEIGSTLYGCRAGDTVIGWVKYWNLPASNGGLFTYSNTSLSGTSPTYGTKSLAFRIL